NVGSAASLVLRPCDLVRPSIRLDWRVNRDNTYSALPNLVEPYARRGHNQSGVFPFQDLEMGHGHGIRADRRTVPNPDVSKPNPFWKNPCTARPADCRVKRSPFERSSPYTRTFGH